MGSSSNSNSSSSGSNNYNDNNSYYKPIYINLKQNVAIIQSPATCKAPNIYDRCNTRGKKVCLSRLEFGSHLFTVIFMSS